MSWDEDPLIRKRMDRDLEVMREVREGPAGPLIFRVICRKDGKVVGEVRGSRHGRVLRYRDFNPHRVTFGLRNKVESRSKGDRPARLRGEMGMRAVLLDFDFPYSADQAIEVRCRCGLLTIPVADVADAKVGPSRKLLL